MECNKLSAEVWNYCVKIDEEYYEQFHKYMDMSTMQNTVRNYNNLPAKCIVFVYRKYIFARNAMWNSIKTKHENSSKIKLPYKEKRYFNTGWDYQSIKVFYDEGYIRLAKPMVILPDGSKKKPKSIKCYAKTIPQNIVEIELLYRNGLKLAIKYKEPDIKHVIQSDNVVSIDLGEIHSITSIDNNGNSIIITGRKIRSIKRFRNKEQGKLKSKMSKCTKYSKQYKKYITALHRLELKGQNQILDGIHKTTKLYLDYCLENEISKVYYGDLDSCTRDTKERVGKFVGQKLNQWNYGLLMQQLENKLTRYGIELVKVKEYYSSKKCPSCHKLNTPKGRKYKCKCGYKQHRDIVGAINILNDNHGTELTHFTNMKYLRIE
jgi:putative transposase